MDDEKLRALPWDVPDYHIRQAAHLRALAENAPTSRVKAGLMAFVGAFGGRLIRPEPEASAA